ncbi:hypothetical protein QBC32DRAFT_12491 [Pseudoneurospora amorphoporcata]|uniref:Zn(2)-C6 fungal-type domain-containing protein n=1 Tax=Pseudoneurospora amorphoporcata TaxID=241081 RepID=A0AAN6NR49_9PEZI|nr:hypothetical protein QBC32DRAFT_12491 [Pseudoneurospora amorphoporcata]
MMARSILLPQGLLTVSICPLHPTFSSRTNCVFQHQHHHMYVPQSYLFFEQLPLIDLLSSALQHHYRIYRCSDGGASRPPTPDPTRRTSQPKSTIPYATRRHDTTRLRRRCQKDCKSPRWPTNKKVGLTAQVLWAREVEWVMIQAMMWTGTSGWCQRSLRGGTRRRMNTQPSAQQRPRGPDHPIKPSVVPAHPSSHTQPRASGNSSDLADIDQQQSGHENQGFTPKWDIAEDSEILSCLDSLDDSQAINYSAEMPSESGAPAQICQQLLPAGQPAHSYQQSLLAQPGSTHQQPLPVIEQHIQPYGLSPPELVDTFQGYDSPSHAGHVTQSDTPVQPAQPLSEDNHVHRQRLRTLLPDPAQPAQGPNLPDQPQISELAQTGGESCPETQRVQIPQSCEPCRQAKRCCDSGRPTCLTCHSHSLPPADCICIGDKIISSPVPTLMTLNRHQRARSEPVEQSGPTSAEVRVGQLMSTYARQREESGRWPLELKIEMVKMLESGKRNGRQLVDMYRAYSTQYGIRARVIESWWDNREEVLLHERKLNVIKYIQDRRTSNEDKQLSLAAAAYDFGVNIDTVTQWWDLREVPGLREEVIRFIQESSPRPDLQKEAALKFDVPENRVSRWMATERKRESLERNKAEEEHNAEDGENRERHEVQKVAQKQAYNSPYSDEQKDEVIRFIRARYDQHGVIARAAREFGIDRTTISKWKKGMGEK